MGKFTTKAESDRTSKTPYQSKNPGQSARLKAEIMDLQQKASITLALLHGSRSLTEKTLAEVQKLRAEQQQTIDQIKGQESLIENLQKKLSLADERFNFAQRALALAPPLLHAKQSTAPMAPIGDFIPLKAEPEVTNKISISEHAKRRDFTPKNS